MSEDEVRTLVHEAVAKHNELLKTLGADRKGSGSFNAWCRANGINRGHASEFMNSKKPPPLGLLDVLGLEWRIHRKDPS